MPPMHRLFGVLLGLVGACRSEPAAAPVPPPLPEVRHGHRVEALAGGLLVFGGYSRGAAAADRGTRATWRLPPGGDRWRRAADLGTGRTFFASAVIGDRAFAVGEGVERYDAAADRWVEVVPAGVLPRSHFAAAAVGRELFVLGGFGGTGTGMWRVDTDAGTVAEMVPPPGFRDGDHCHILCELGGALHIVGGLDGAQFQPTDQHWVLRDDVFSAAPPPPVGLWAKFAAWAVHRQRLFVFSEAGGWCFDPARQTWRERRPMPHRLAMPAAVAWHDRILVFGGLPVDRPGPGLLVYDIASDAWTVATTD